MKTRHRLAACSIALLPVLVGPAAASAATPPTSAKDYAIIARDIMPSGEYGGVPSPTLLPKEEQQAEMYNALTPLFNHVTAADVFSDFKPFGVGTGVTGPLTQEVVPHAGVTILRDAYDVPHVYGVTRDDVTWGAGWVVAEDRNLLLNEARNIAELAAIDAPGLSAIQDRATHRVDQRDVLIDQLRHVLIAGRDQYLLAAAAGAARERADHVIGFDARHAQHRQSERIDCLEQRLGLRSQLIGHRRSMGFVFSE